MKSIIEECTVSGEGIYYPVIREIGWIITDIDNKLKYQKVERKKNDKA